MKNIIILLISTFCAYSLSAQTHTIYEKQFALPTSEEYSKDTQHQPWQKAVKALLTDDKDYVVNDYPVAMITKTLFRNNKSENDLFSIVVPDFKLYNKYIQAPLSSKVIRID